MGYFTCMAINKETTTQKLIAMPKSLAEQVSEFRYDNRLPSEAEAIRRLIMLGLEVSRRDNNGVISRMI